jgi:putative heme transporter
MASGSGAHAGEARTAPHKHKLEEVFHTVQRASARIPRWLRRTLSALAGLALVAVVAAHSRQAFADVRHISHPRPWLLGLAILAEAGSLSASTLTMRQLLRRDGLVVGARPLVRLTLAGVAMSATLPAGDAASAAYWVRELQREGADHAHAAIMLTRLTIAAVVSLAALLAVGIAVAGSSGPLAGARVWILAAGGVAIVAVPLLWPSVARVVRRRLPNLPAPLNGHKATWCERRTAVGMLTLAIWLFDCAALVLALRALHVAVPAEGVLATYCLAQIVAAVPLLPGGAGTVEASLAVGFTTYGETAGPVVAGVLLYRLISQWGIVPLGWGAVLAAKRRALAV